MKRSDLTDLEALDACTHMAEGPARGAIEVLQQAGWPFKIALRKLEQLEDRGLIESGVSLNYPWLTPKGKAALHDIRPHMYNHP